MIQDLGEDALWRRPRIGTNLIAMTRFGAITAACLVCLTVAAFADENAVLEKKKAAASKAKSGSASGAGVSKTAGKSASKPSAIPSKKMSPSEAKLRAEMKIKLGKEGYLKWLEEREGALSGKKQVPARGAPNRAWTKPEDFQVEGIDYGDAGGSGNTPTAPADAPLERDSDSAVRSALSGSSMMKQWERTPEALGDLKTAGARAPLPPSDSGTPSGLVAGAYSGFAASYRREGLQVGSDADGRPRIETLKGEAATPAQIARLRARLAAEPRALLKRPDFFQVLPRPRFNALKAAYRASPALREGAFQDIAMSPQGRDFSWSRSCHALSGGCNPASALAHYSRGDFVAPETLNGVYERVEQDDEDALEVEDDEDLDWLDEDWDDYTEEEERMADAADHARGKLSGGVLARAAGALKGLLGRAGRIFGGGSSFASGEAASGRPVPEAASEESFSADAGAGVSPGGESGSARPRRASSPASRAEIPARGPLTQERPPVSGRALLYLACAAGALGFFLLGFARRG